MLEKVSVSGLRCSALGKTETNVVSPSRKRLNAKDATRKNIFNLLVKDNCYSNLLDSFNGFCLLLGEPRMPASSAKLKVTANLLLVAVKHD